MYLLGMLNWKHAVIVGALYLVVFLLNLVLSKKTQIDDWAEANPVAAGWLKILRGFGIDPWVIVQGISLLFQKKLPDYTKQSLAEVQKPKGVKPPFLPVFMISMLLGIMMLFVSTSCKEAMTPSAISTDEQVASLLCKQYFSSKKGLSLEDAGRAFCSTEQAIAPFLHEIFGARQRAGVAVETRAALPESDAGAQ